jgi:hypothetical protein
LVPHQIASPRDDNKALTAETYAKFAKNMGATELPELLETEAVHTAFVEGAYEFLRPKVLRRLRTVAGGGYNREDGLRSFADLLRAGRFSKARN